MKQDQQLKDLFAADLALCKVLFYNVKTPMECWDECESRRQKQINCSLSHLYKQSTRFRSEVLKGRFDSTLTT